VILLRLSHEGWSIATPVMAWIAGLAGNSIDNSDAPGEWFGRERHLNILEG
jgi:hypothetical protein